jgi:hypothetical protein
MDDVSKLDELDRIFKIKEDSGKLDIVCANSAIVTLAALGEITEETANSNGGSNE